MSSALFLRDGEDEYKLHPVVVFSILDNFKRRELKQTRVVGTLLGERIGNVVHIRECFPVPHTEREDTVNRNLFARLISLVIAIARAIFLLHWRTNNPFPRLSLWFVGRAGHDLP